MTRARRRWVTHQIPYAARVIEALSPRVGGQLDGVMLTLLQLEPAGHIAAR